MTKCNDGTLIVNIFPKFNDPTFFHGDPHLSLIATRDVNPIFSYIKLSNLYCAIRYGKLFLRILLHCIKR